MAVKPILFSTEMVRAILDKRKTVTRQVIKGADPDWSFTGLSNDIEIIGCDRYGTEYPKRVDGVWATFEGWNGYTDYPCFKAPYQPGDILYVRETWDTEPVAPDGCFQPGGVWYYKADGDLRPDAWRGNWRSPIHMPREAARIFLRVTMMWVERLQGITEEQARAEGVEPAFEYNTLEGPVIYLDEDGYFYYGFKALWDRRIKPKDRSRYGWAANPWCFVTEFEQISKEDTMI